MGPPVNPLRHRVKFCGADEHGPVAAGFYKRGRRREGMITKRGDLGDLETIEDQREQ